MQLERERERERERQLGKGLEGLDSASLKNIYPKYTDVTVDTEREDEDFDRDFDAAVRDAMAEHGT